MSDFNLPIDFENKMKALLQDEWDDFKECYDNQQYQALRINALKLSDAAILKSLGMTHPVPVLWASHGYYYEQHLRPGKHPYHEMGLYYIQEPSAMSAAELLFAKPGDFVLDLCSAPGGKATQLAAFLMGEGLLVANEIHPARCRILSQNIERMGIGNALVTNEDPKDLAARFPVFFDKILVDAPCSGEGMFRKNPDAMDEWSLEQVGICAKRQAEILEQAAVMLKPGGKMVYSTCTFAPEEDEMTIAGFLEKHPDFAVAKVKAPCFSPAKGEWAGYAASHLHLENTFRLWPHKLHGEGHYVAVLEKKEVYDNYSYVNQNVHISSISKYSAKEKRDFGKSGRDGVLSKEQKQSLEEFYKETLIPTQHQKLADKNTILFGDSLYALPQGIFSLAGLKVLRPGLHIGTFKKNRFEPSHALALFLKKEDVKRFIHLELQDKRTQGFFRGEGFLVQDGELFIKDSSSDAAVAVSTDEIVKEKGFCLVCVDGFPAGWGKLTGGQLKNHYPKGLRRELS